MRETFSDDDLIEQDDGSAVLRPHSPMEVFAPAKTLAVGARSEEHRQALKAAMDAAGVFSQASLIFEQNAVSALHCFLGYGVLQELSQDAMIRLCINTRTDEMLREWIEIKCDDEARKDALDAVLLRTGVKEILQNAVSLMGFMGGAYVFIDTGYPDDKLADPLVIGEKGAEIKPGKPLRLVVIDPIFVTPQKFNATDPLKDDFYRPSVFFVMGKAVHRSRLIRFVEHEVPYLLRPSYNFLGIPQAQLLSDYVTHFRENREEANRLLQKFSTSFMKTNLKDILMGKASRNELKKRARTFITGRTNWGLGIIDKDTEDFVQVNTPITGVTDLVRQSLEFVVAVNQSNVVKMLGLSPAGFSTGESDLKSHNDLIATLQEKVLRKPLIKLLKIFQLHEFGNIDPELTFEFNPLDEEDDRAVADTQKVKADTAAIYLDRGVITEDEAREALKADDKSAFCKIEGDAPGMPEVPFAEMTPMQGEPDVNSNPQ